MGNMRYSGIIKNDFSAAPGVCTTFFAQGCPHHCPGCHNPETWDFNGGKEFTADTIQEILDSLTANDLHRDLCIMGGEPLCPENQLMTLIVVNAIKLKLPETKIYIWTGYNLDALLSMKDNHKVKKILAQCEAIVDGPYVQELRDITLPMRGSSNQRIIYIKDIDLD